MKTASSEKSIKQLITIFITFSLILSLSIMAMEDLFFEKGAQAVALDNAVNKIKERESVLRAFLNSATEHLEAIRRSDFFTAYLQNPDNTGTKSNLETLFLTLGAANPDIMKLRFIDRQGREQLRINRQNRGSPVHPVVAAELQDKAKRYFFTDSQTKPLEQVWFSTFDLNNENNQIEVPHRPTFRATLPVEQNGEFAGILIINYFVEELIEQLTYTPLYDMILCDDAGYTIFHYWHFNNDHSRCWGRFQYPTYNISAEFPQHFQEIENNQIYTNSSFVSRKLDLPITGGLIMILQLKQSYIESQEKKSQNQYLTTSIVVFVLSLVLTFFIIKIFSHTLLNLDKVTGLNEHLRHLQLRNNLALRVSKLGVWELNLQTQEVSWDAQMHQIYELNPNSEITLESWWDYIDQDDLQRIKDMLMTDLDNGELEDNSNFWITTPGGERKSINIFWIKEFSESQKPLRLIGTNQDVTKDIISQQKYKSLLENAADGIHILDNNGNITECSISFAENLGYTLEEAYKLNIEEWDKDLSRTGSDTLDEFLAKGRDAQQTFETIHQRKDGSRFDVQIKTRIIELEGKLYIYASQRDISAQKDTERAIIRSRDEFSTIFNTALEGIALLGLDTRFKRVNKKFCELLGYSEEELTSIHCYDLLLQNNVDRTRCVYNDVLHKGFVEDFEMEYIRKDGASRIIRSSIILMPNKTEYLMTSIDLTELHTAFEIIKTQSYTDELTQLPNRKAYNERINELIAQRNRYGITFSLLMLDIDHFKEINDTCGHKSGDCILITFSQLLIAIIRKTDYIFRIGGEEFVILLTNTNLNNAAILAEKIRQQIESKLKLNQDKKLTVSIGIAEVKANDDEDTLFKRADRRLYYAKEQGRNRCVTEIPQDAQIPDIPDLDLDNPNP